MGSFSQQVTFPKGHGKVSEGMEKELDFISVKIECLHAAEKLQSFQLSAIRILSISSL